MALKIYGEERWEAESFKKRHNKTNKFKARYFLLFEGNKTEPQYFLNLFDKNKDNCTKGELYKNILITERVGDPYNSFPLKVLNYAINLKENKVDAKSIAEGIIKELKTNKAFNSQLTNEIRQDVLNQLEGLENINLNEISKVLDDINLDIYDYIDQKMILRNVNNYISKTFVYDNTLDEIHVIIDRDKQSLTEEDYNECINIAANNGIKLYVTNPCIEYWFIMHWNKEYSFDENEMLENKKGPSKNSKNYAKQLWSRIKSEKSNNVATSRCYDFEHIKNAIEIIDSNYSTELLELKNNLGSNLTTFIKYFFKI